MDPTAAGVAMKVKVIHIQKWSLNSGGLIGIGERGLKGTEVDQFCVLLNNDL